MAFAPPVRVTRSASPHTEGRRPTSPPRRERLSKLKGLPRLQAHISLVSELGAGSFSKVMLGQERCGRYVAVKAISLKLAQAKGSEESRLWREVQVMKEVQHANLVRLVDVMASWEPLPKSNVEPPFLCIVMEYAANTELLSKRIRKSPALPALAEHVAAQLASALGRLHRANIVHRDVWAENVLIDDHDKVILLDLGCAEYLAKPCVNNKLNIPYMSPECAAGLPQQVGDDCWALGLLITEMVTGRFVVERLGRSDLPLHFQRGVFGKALSETVQKASPVLGRLCAQLLDFVVSRRPAMASVANLLRRNEGPSPGNKGSLCRDRKSTRHTASQPPQPPLGFRGRLNVSPLRRVDASPVRGGFRLARSAAVPARNSFGGKTAAFQGTPAMTFKAGQTVMYCPRSAGVQRAIIQGRAAEGHGWSIQLETGCCIDVDDSEDWRLCLCDLPMPPADCVATPSPRLLSEKGPVLAWAPEAAAPQKVLSASSTVSSLATALTASTAETSMVEASPMPKKAAEAKPMPKYYKVPEPPPWASRCVSPLRAVQASTSISRGIGDRPRLRDLQPGRRVMYTRSNGLRYTGVVRGPSANGVHIFLDCGEGKDVDESEAWRLAF